MLSDDNQQTEYRAKLQVLLGSLDAAQAILQSTSDCYPVLKTRGRSFARIARAVQRPMRLAILGESNSGKTSLASVIAGGIALPALPVPNTRLPTLLQYAQVPFVRTLYANGMRSVLSPGDNVQLENIIRLEVGLPSQTLRRLEVLDFPGGANPLLPTVTPSMLQHGVDAAIWATVATQAWRASERLAWLALPSRIRSRGLLAVTHSDLLSSTQELKRLFARLEMAAKPYFRGMGLVAAPDGRPAGLADPRGTPDLFSQIGQLVKQFSAGRLEKAVIITRRLAGQTLDKLGLVTDCS